MFRVMNVLAAIGSDKIQSRKAVQSAQNAFPEGVLRTRMPDIEGEAAGDTSPFPHLIHHTTVEFVLQLHYITSDLERKDKVMAKTAMVQARIEPELKSEVEKILRSLGLNTTYAISVFFKQIKLHKGIPFAVEIPNAETRKAIEDSRKGKNLVKVKNAAELFKELGV